MDLDPVLPLTSCVILSSLLPILSLSLLIFKIEMLTGLQGRGKRLAYACFGTLAG